MPSWLVLPHAFPTQPFLSSHPIGRVYYLMVKSTRPIAVGRVHILTVSVNNYVPT